MKLIVLYRVHSEWATTVELYIRDFKKLHPEAELEVQDYDSVQGTQTADLYDILQQPAIIAVKNDGAMAERWIGDRLPLMSDLAYYARA